MYVNILYVSLKGGVFFFVLKTLVLGASFFVSLGFVMNFIYIGFQG